MQVNVMLSSGDIDEWVGVADAFDETGSLVVVSRIESDEVPEDMKTCVLGRQIDQGPDLPPMEQLTTYEVNAMYAPGMWMKVEYVAGS